MVLLQRCIEVDPDWWKGYWYRGQALLKMLRNKPPSTAMSERCEQAKIAFEGCLKCSTLPESKRPMVRVVFAVSGCVICASMNTHVLQCVEVLWHRRGYPHERALVDNIARRCSSVVPPRYVPLCYTCVAGDLFGCVRVCMHATWFVPG